MMMNNFTLLPTFPASPSLPKMVAIVLFSLPPCSSPQ